MRTDHGTDVHDFGYAVLAWLRSRVQLTVMQLLLETSFHLIPFTH
jgi:hypothetical protein